MKVGDLLILIDRETEKTKAMGAIESITEYQHYGQLDLDTRVWFFDVMSNTTRYSFGSTIKNLSKQRADLKATAEYFEIIEG